MILIFFMRQLST